MSSGDEGSYEEIRVRGNAQENERVCEDNDQGSSSNVSKGTDDGESTRRTDQASGGKDRRSESDDGSSDDSDTGESKRFATQDGHELSEYELLRLERIRRNKDYLASLGLDKTKPRAQQSNARPRKKTQSQPISLRSSLSRSSKNKQISYAEKPVKDSTADEKLPVAKREKPPSASSRIQSRLDRFIYNEFRRIEAESKRNLQQAEKNVRAARNELKHTLRALEKHERKEKKRIEREQLMRESEEEKKYLRGTKREVLQEFDRRVEEIRTAIRYFDEAPNARECILHQAQQQEENRRKIEMLDSARRFPHAMKLATRELDTLLLERVPRDLPPPRRNTRRRELPETQRDSKDDRDPKKARVGEPGEADERVDSELTIAIRDESMLDSSAKWRNSDEAALEASSKPRKKRDAPSRNVGGWISPAFASEINRNWLEQDSVDTEDFDLSSFVPQVGDTLLYYPAGHRSFLKAHPDELGKKTRQILRLPLWERALREQLKYKETTPEKEDGGRERSRSSWWTDAWLASVEASSGNYPILCRVERTHAEFPPDPHAEHRIVKRDKKAGGVSVVWTIPKHAIVGNKRKHDVHLCLAVTMRPLTPLLQQEMELPVQSVESRTSLLPPIFTAVTFPSRKASPFMIPFSWAYRRWHSLELGALVKLKSDETFVAEVKSFKSLGDHGRYGEGRLDDKRESINRLVTTLRSGPDSVISTLGNTLKQDAFGNSSSQATISLVDALVVMNVLEENGSEPSSSSPPAIGLMDMIRITLPLWKGVRIEGTAARKRAVNSWDLEFVEADSSTSSLKFGPLGQASHVQTGLACSLDESLGAQLEFILDRFVKDTPDASLFSLTLTDEDIPSYGCAVPLSMSFNRVLQRLAREGHSSCYYRSVGCLLNDISMIQDNCILFNSPDSDVVRTALDIIPSLKQAIATAASQHYKDQVLRQKREEERRHSVLLQCQSPVMKTGEDESPASTTGRRAVSKKRSRTLEPYTGRLARWWIQSFHPNGSWPQTPSPSLVRQLGWVPQHGDSVYYSRSRHSTFVLGHNRSLTLAQCQLPVFPSHDSPSDPTSADGTQLTARLQNQWLVGRVIWTRAEFPRDQSKDSDCTDTFDIPAPVLAIGLTFSYRWAGPQSVYRVCWRPCALIENTKDPTIAPPCECPGCGLVLRDSFLVPDWLFKADLASGKKNATSILFEPELVSNEASALSSHGMAEDDISSIDRCLDVLKRRCIDGVPVDHVDPKLKNMDALKSGWLGPSVKLGKVPSFPRLLQRSFSVGGGRSAGNDTVVRTRGVETVDEESVSLLAKLHFLPPWISSILPTVEAPQKTNCDGIAKSLSFHEMVSPNPNLCLELIQLRIRHGYYRRSSAIVHDIQEAYIASLIPVLFESARRRRGRPFSTRKVAKAFSAKDTLEYFSYGQNSHNQSLPEPLMKKYEAEEWKCLHKIYPVRCLYGAALVCASDSVSMERIFGTLPRRRTKLSDTTSPLDSSALEKTMTEGRQGLAYILAALADESVKDALSLRSVAPTVAIRITGTLEESRPSTRESVVNESGYESDGMIGGDPNAIDLSKRIVIGPYEMQASDALTATFFGTVGRMRPCGRCSALGSSMYSCRVLRKHSNIDFDWIETFKRFGSINDMLRMIKFGESRPQYSTIPSNTVDPSTSETSPLPQELVQEAKIAVDLAVRLETEAKKASAQPARLSEDFIKTAFPIDPSDGHYNYCIVCGFSGDVLCCERCPNVVHPTCINLSEIPDEDWFCHRCRSTGNASDTMLHKGHASPGPEGAICVLVLAAPSPSSTKDIEDPASRLAQLLVRLRAHRQKSTRRDKRDGPSAAGRTAPDAYHSTDDKNCDSDVDERLTVEIGTVVVKHFGDHGEFTGVVERIPLEKPGFYHVRYQDDDSEDLSEGEVERLAKQAKHGTRKSNISSTGRPKRGCGFQSRSRRLKVSDDSQMVQPSNDTNLAGHSSPTEGHHQQTNKERTTSVKIGKWRKGQRTASQNKKAEPRSLSTQGNTVRDPVRRKAKRGRPRASRDAREHRTNQPEEEISLSVGPQGRPNGPAEDGGSQFADDTEIRRKRMRPARFGASS